MLELDKVRCEQFAACVNQDFEIVTSAGPLVLQLFEARPLGGADRGAVREPFALTFRGPPQLGLPQGIYKLSHPQLGEMEIFIVPISPTDFEAVFN